MARSREFDESVALEKATITFWEKGYEDTSYDDLVGSTGVSRYGLYSAFGDKKEFFLKALDHYLEMNRCEMMGSLLSEDASLQEVKAYFRRMEDKDGDPKKRVGCMLCNTAIEMAQYDKDAEERVKVIFEELKTFIKKALVTAKSKGELNKAADPDQLADYLLGLMLGAAMMVRSPIELPKIRNFIETGLSVLK
ncbi:MAG: TetR/AcrR family transcriptional regulator [Sphingomonadales bacterium]